jgi:hypothetical protein
MTITILEIKERVSNSSQIAQTVFSDLVASKNQITLAYLNASAIEDISLAFKETENFEHLELKSKQDKKIAMADEIMEHYCFDTIMVYVKNRKLKNQNQLFLRVPFLRNLIIPYFIGPLLNINGSALNKIRNSDYKTYLEVVDSIFFAGLYNLIINKI